MAFSRGSSKSGGEDTFTLVKNTQREKRVKFSLEGRYVDYNMGLKRSWHKTTTIVIKFENNQKYRTSTTKSSAVSILVQSRFSSLGKPNHVGI